jgi:Xaa-Pro aminopeptidase
MNFQSDFSPKELARCRKKLSANLPGGASALIPGAGEPSGVSIFRQFNDFYYLCGVEVPHSYLLLSNSGESTLFLPDTGHYGPFTPQNADWVIETTGLDAVKPLSHLTRQLQWERLLYLPSREGEGERESWDGLERWRQSVLNDPLDGRRGRISQISANLRNDFPMIELRDLSPHLDEMRVIKSEKEIELMRRAGELTGLGALAAMRATRPGIMEYQLHAELEHVYINGGARGPAYAPIIPGSANAGDSHYLANNSVLEDGDIVLIDCAPDYRYYTSDIGRMWPVNGRFSEEQRALYSFVLAYHKTLLRLIKPGAMREEIHLRAAEEMRPRFERWDFVSKKQRETGACLFDYTDHVSHGVGMCVHDVSLHHSRPFEPGMVFAVDPMAWDHRNGTFYRVEDTVVITEDGCENLTSSCPIEIEDVEKAMQSTH